MNERDQNLMPESNQAALKNQDKSASDFTTNHYEVIAQPSVPWVGLVVIALLAALLLFVENVWINRLIVALVCGMAALSWIKWRNYKEIYWTEKWAKRSFKREFKEEKDNNVRLEQSMEDLVRNSRQELEQAKEVQQSLLPKDFDLCEKLRCSVVYRPCVSVGGDLYDLFALDENNLAFIIADASGHGVGASLMSVILKLHVERYKEVLSENFEDGHVDPHSLGKFVACINKAMHDSLQSGRFASCLIGIVNQETRKVFFANAGHNQPMVWYHENGHTEEIDLDANIVLGILPEADFFVQEVDFHEGDKLLVYTDGFNERMNMQDREWGIHNMLQSFRENGDQDIDSIIRQIELACRTFAGGREQDDDQAMILIEFK